MRETVQPPQAHQNHTSQVRTMARQVQEMFPYMPLSLIIADLQTSHSIEATIDNILEGRLQVTNHYQEADNLNSESAEDINLAASSANALTIAGPSSAQSTQSARDYYVSPNLSVEQFRASGSTQSAGSNSDDSSPLTSSSSSGYEIERSTSIFGNQQDLLREESFEDVSSSIVQFSNLSEEREKILKKRKDQLILNARKR